MSSRAFWLGVDPGVAGGQSDPRLLPNHCNVIGFDHGGGQPLCEPKPFVGGYSMQSNAVVRLLRTFAVLACLVVLITAFTRPVWAAECDPVTEQEPNDEYAQDLDVIAPGECVTLTGTIDAGLGADPQNPPPDYDTDYVTFELIGAAFTLEFAMPPPTMIFYGAWDHYTGQPISGHCEGLVCTFEAPPVSPFVQLSLTAQDATAYTVTIRPWRAVPGLRHRK